jgi:hypothetical protein
MAPDERDGGAAGRGRGATAVGVETGIRDVVAVHAEREANPIAAGAAAGDDGGRASRDAAESLGGGQVVLEGERIHAREHRDAPPVGAETRRPQPDDSGAARSGEAGC